MIIGGKIERLTIFPVNPTRTVQSAVNRARQIIHSAASPLDHHPMTNAAAVTRVLAGVKGALEGFGAGWLVLFELQEHLLNLVDDRVHHLMRFDVVGLECVATVVDHDQLSVALGR